MIPAQLLAETAARLPDAPPAELFRMCLLLSHAIQQRQHGEPFQPQDLPRLIQELQLQLALHEDQHAAVAGELDCLASTEPCQFHMNQLWTLIRAIKVQSQLLELYLGPQAALQEA